MGFEEQKKNLVLNLKKQGYIKKKSVENAFLKIPREEFISEKAKNYAYTDTPLDIGNNQTISAPHMIAIMCEELEIKQGQKILEIGTGSGYHAAIVSAIVGNSGHVYTTERHEELAYNASINLNKAKITNVTIEINDGSLGLKKYAPFDRIYVTCAAPDIPQPLIDQLKDNGKMLIPIGQRICRLYLIIKNNEKIEKKDLGGCAFVPLIGKYGHQSL